MIISKVTEKQLYDALEAINKHFDNNVIFNRMDRLGDRRFAITLRVKSSKGCGARLGFHKTSKGNRRHLISACWHVHGYFFEALPEEAVIRSNGKIIGHHDWHDWNAGSIMEPVYMSELCECGG